MATSKYLLSKCFKHGFITHKCVTSKIMHRYKPCIINKVEKFKCWICNTVSKSYQSISEHIKQCHPQSVLHCGYCHFSTGYKVTLLKHHTRQHPNTPKKWIQKCEKCRFICTQSQSLVLHGLTHLKAPRTKPLVCTKCNFESPDTRTFNSHILRHFNDDPYRCTYCSKWFRYIRSLDKHIKRSHPKHTHKCDLCNVLSGLPHVLSKHRQRQHIIAKKEQNIIRKYNKYDLSATQATHGTSVHYPNSPGDKHDDKPYSCPHCTKAYTQAGTLNIHIQSKHVALIVKCEQCAFSTGIPNLMSEHITEHHKDRGSLLRCKNCKFVTTKPESLILHDIVHSTKKPYRCTTCDFQTMHIQGFNSHVLKHYNDKPYSCSHCTLSYILQSSLQTHIKSHHSEAIVKCSWCEYRTGIPDLLQEHQQKLHSSYYYKLLKCEQCSFTATKAVSLQLHQTIHTASPPYTCALCERKCESADHINYHILSHNNDRPCRCLHCIKCFIHIEDLNKHVKSYHPGEVKKCNYCDFTTGLSTLMEEHKTHYHSARLNSLMKCPDCTFICTKPMSLLLHKHLHQTKGHYECQCVGCSYKTPHTNSYNLHVLGHCKDYPYMCPCCIKCYHRLPALNKHIKLHHPEYTCKSGGSLSWECYWDMRFTEDKVAGKQKTKENEVTNS